MLGWLVPGWCVGAGRGVGGRVWLELGVVAGWWRWGCGCAASGAGRGLDEQGQVADALQGCGEGRGPWPARREAEFAAAAVVDEAGGHSEEPVADGGRDGELVGGVDTAEAGGPAHEVVGEHAAGEPGAVGEEPSRGAAAESGVFFEVTNGEFDGGVGSVVGVGGDGVEVVSVGDEAVVTPVGPQLGGFVFVAAAQPVAAAAGFDGGLSHLGLSAAGVGDRLPGVLVYGLDGCFDLGVLCDGDREARVVGPDGGGVSWFV